MSSLPSSAEGVNFPLLGTSTDPPFAGSYSIVDSKALSEAGSIDMDSLDLGLSHPALFFYDPSLSALLRINWFFSMSMPTF